MTTTRLHQIPKNSKIFADCSDGSKSVTFKKLDGAFSYCETEKGNPVHLSANTPLTKSDADGGYFLAIESD